MTYLIILTFVLSSASTQGAECDEFLAVKCVLTENNIVGYSRENLTQSCQESCLATEDCEYFTHYQADAQCYHLRSCQLQEDCEDCVSGPTQPPFSSCPWPPSPTTTSTTPTTPGLCEEYVVGMQCDLDELNVIETLHSPSIGDCQTGCQSSPECSWFTWYNDASHENPSLCLLLRHCDEQQACDGCISGPRDGEDVEVCFGEESSSTSSTVTSSTTSRTTEMTTTGDCDMFSSAACDITEHNTIEVRHDLSVGGCQDACTLTGECHSFTWHPTIASRAVCFLLRECNTFQTCPYCISGPSEEGGADVDSCYDFTTTTAPGTTESTTTERPDSTSQAEQCDQFVTGTCDIDDTNTLDVMHDVTVGQCQDMCLYSELCHWFTWYNVSGWKGTCWFLDHCDSQEPCPECISGPALGTDVDNCL